MPLSYRLNRFGPATLTICMCMRNHSAQSESIKLPKPIQKQAPRGLHAVDAHSTAVGDGMRAGMATRVYARAM
eukprot:3949225-Amphidinium_carterae.1